MVVVFTPFAMSELAFLGGAGLKNQTWEVPGDMGVGGAESWPLLRQVTLN